MTIDRDIQLSKPLANNGIRAFLLLMRASSEITELPARITRQHGITPTQFNILRILRGSPAGLPCSEISARMVARDSDVTRLLDRLVRSGLVVRIASHQDRRVVQGQITPAGEQLCDRLNPVLEELHRKQFERFGEQNTQQLITLLEQLRTVIKEPDDAK
ncbi:MAG: MarR family transcriptional regulator [Planctomycetes bacterium]|nr:MarR family transcriptional regulator [Planctomycetota bacterium]